MNRHKLNSKSYDSFVEWQTGNCYAHSIFSDEKDAKEYSKALREADLRVNGGWYHGMLLGGIQKHERKDGTVVYSVMD